MGKGGGGGCCCRAASISGPEEEDDGGSPPFVSVELDVLDLSADRNGALPLMVLREVEGDTDAQEAAVEGREEG